MYFKKIVASEKNRKYFDSAEIQKTNLYMRKAQRKVKITANTKNVKPFFKESV